MTASNTYCTSIPYQARLLISSPCLHTRETGFLLDYKLTFAKHNNKLQEL